MWQDMLLRMENGTAGGHMTYSRISYLGWTTLLQVGEYQVWSCTLFRVGNATSSEANLHMVRYAFKIAVRYIGCGKIRILGYSSLGEKRFF